MAALAQNPRGVVYWTPRLVALAKPALHDRPADWAQLAQSPCTADGWYVYLLVGDLGWARELAADLPQLRWLCFQRGLRSPRPHVQLWRRLLPH